MNRRQFILGAVTLGGSTILAASAIIGRSHAENGRGGKIIRIERTPREWQARLTPAQYHILRQEGTERAFSSPLNEEKRKGLYVCAGCDLDLFTSAMKYDSGTGWPSFFEAIPGHLQTKTDYRLIYPRTEYHCARCGGHQGHVFDDGPPPTHKRWCNNGLALKFIPA